VVFEKGVAMNEKQKAKRQFIEDAGDLLEEHGLPHMAGRVLGALMICVPPHMSMDQLAEELQASKGSISSATQLLLRLGIIEKISMPGHRRHYYRPRSNLWSDLFAQRTEHLNKHQELADQGLQVIADETLEMKQRLIEMQVFFDFVEKESPGFAERWEKQRPHLLKKRLALHK